jgi:serine O-acetyltransferase
MHSTWKRLGGFHGMLAMSIYRYGSFVYRKVHIPIIRQFAWIFYRLIDMFFVRILLGAEFPAQCTIGKGLILPHGASGIYINNHSTIGDNVTIFHQVTLGVRNGDFDAPQVGDGVLIGAGAKILGNIAIGTGSQIGANAVVLQDVPPQSTAVGIPARIIIKAQSTRESQTV